MGTEDLLFYSGDLDATLRAQQQNIVAKVDAIPQAQFMNAPVDDIVENIAASMTVEPLTLYEDRAEMEQRETQIDVSSWRDRNPFHDPGPIYVPGVHVTVMIPYTGEASLWNMRPNQWQSVFPRARITSNGNASGALHVEISQPADAAPEAFKSRLQEELRSIRFFVGAQRGQVDGFNAALPGQVNAAVMARRQRVQKHQGLQDVLGIPLRRKEGAPSTEILPLTRKLIRPLPPPPKSGYKPEPGISDEDFRHILSVVRHEGRTFEATPRTFAVHDEEELRDILLAHLNGHYQGDATGETFRRVGKTDIRIEDGTRAAFVAECKIWKGAKELSDAIDQLLGYLTWRDCKASLILFNKHNAKFSGLLDVIPQSAQSHPLFRKAHNVPDAGEWEFDMRSKEDEGRIVRVRVFAFNLFSSDKT